MKKVKSVSDYNLPRLFIGLSFSVLQGFGETMLFLPHSALSWNFSLTQQILGVKKNYGSRCFGGPQNSFGVKIFLGSCAFLSYHHVNKRIISLVYNNFICLGLAVERYIRIFPYL